MSKQQNNYESAMESIGQALFEMYGKDTPKEVINLLNNLDQSYILSKFPESQDYMENKDSIFCGGSEEITGSSAYFVPLKIVL